MPLLFVYGTLRSKKPNHHMLGSAKRLGIATVHGFKHASDSSADAPAVVVGKPDDDVQGEVYDTDEHHLAAIDHYEAPDFTRHEVTLDDGRDAFMYLREYKSKKGVDRDNPAIVKAAKDHGFDLDELVRGVNEEMEEHGFDLATGIKVASDHLVKIPDYYTRVFQMEDEAKAEEPVRFPFPLVVLDIENRGEIFKPGWTTGQYGAVYIDKNKKMGETFKGNVHEFEAWLISKGSPPVTSYNTDGDKKKSAAEGLDLEWGPDIMNAVLPIMDKAGVLKRLDNGPKARPKWPDLEEAAAFFGVTPGEAHEEVPDAITAAGIVLALEK